jgi:peptide/nickel transport system substrate-binding protein
LLITIGTGAAIAAAIGVGRWRLPQSEISPIPSHRGGELVASSRSDPRSFNRFVTRDQTEDLIGLLTHAKLVRINRVTQELEPSLAESWTRSEDGLSYTLTLRPDVSFSDGHPFTADDVVFSVQAAYAPKSLVADSLQVDGKNLQVNALDDRTVAIVFPSAFAPGLRLLDNLPIVPRHKLEAALRAGTLASAWGLSTPPAEIVGLGPFALAEYTPGQRVVVTRNPHYWKKDANGTSLPYLDRVTIQITPDQDAQLLQLDSGQIDMTGNEIRPEDHAPLARAAAAGRITLLDLGPAYDADSLWFNLKPGGLGSDPRGTWLQRDELRHAISLAVDRQAFVDTVFLGAGVPVFGPVTPANKKWYWTDLPKAPHDPERAKQLLASVGLIDRNGDGLLEDSNNQPARFTLITQKGHTALERGASVIRDELRKVGLIVDVVALDFAAVIQRFTSGNYEAVFFNVYGTDTDPAINADFWLSSGSTHLWNMSQKSPSTIWEQRIDELMSKQTAASDERERKRLFDEVQRIFVEHEPILYFAAPRVYVAVSSRVTNLRPALIRPQLLWAAETLAVTSSPRTTH